MERRSAILTVVLFFVLLFGWSLLFGILPDRDFSEIENRALSARPRLTLARLLRGQYAKDVDDYFSDQFPMRETLVAVKAILHLLCTTI